MRLFSANSCVVVLTINSCELMNVNRLCTLIGQSLIVVVAVGCGATKTQQITDQMLMSNAVDRTIEQVDFRVLAGRKVFLDTRHLKIVKGMGFVNADYIISSLRQQMFASHARLVESSTEADVVVEARVGTLGTDEHDITYGVPASSTISTAASLVPNAPTIPAIPELSLARRTIQLGGAKVALFAYDQKTKRPIWQSGVKMAMSDARSFWILGAGPFQRGTIFEGTQFAGSQLQVSSILGDSEDKPDEEPRVAYGDEYVFDPPAQLRQPVQLSSFVKSSPAESNPDESTAAPSGGNAAGEKKE
jgi:hypothetical protein